MENRWIKFVFSADFSERKWGMWKKVRAIVIIGGSGFRGNGMMKRRFGKGDVNFGRDDADIRN